MAPLRQLTFINLLDIVSSANTVVEHREVVFVIVVGEFIEAGLKTKFTDSSIIVIQRHGQRSLISDVYGQTLAVDEELPDDIPPHGLVLVPSHEW